MRNRLLGFSLVLLVACSGHHALTFRSACQTVADTVCARVAECSPPGVPNCAQTFVTTCCASASNCDAEIPDQGAQAAFDQCVADYKKLSCQAVQNGDVPPSCQ